MDLSLVSRSHDAGMIWKRHHWPGTGMIQFRIDKRSHDAGMKPISVDPIFLWGLGTKVKRAKI